MRGRLPPELLLADTGLGPGALQHLARRLRAADVFDVVPPGVDELIALAKIVGLMQLGFGLLELGSVRPVSTLHVLLKNLADLFVGSIGWYLLGHALAAFGSMGSVQVPWWHPNGRASHF